MTESLQKIKAEQFKKLHHQSEILVLPNIWDPLGAAMLENLGYAAVATASASIAWTNGYQDGEHIPFSNVLMRLTNIVASTSLPVTADIESGYAASEKELMANIEKLISTGIIGINLEDYDRQTDSLYPISTQCKRIRAVRKVGEDLGVPLFINARTDVYLRPKSFLATVNRINETLTRAKAYLDAGADGLFPPGMTDTEELANVVATLKCPVNVFAVRGIPNFKTLKEIGVARVSLGPGLLKIAFKAMKDLAKKIKTYEGLDEVINPEVSPKI